LEKFNKQPRLYNALKSEKLVMLNEQHAELSVMNKSLEQVLLKIKSRIVNFLRDKTGLLQLEFSFRISEKNTDDSGEYLYTDRDKYQYLLKKNPNLEKLKNDFDLDY